MTGAQDPRTRFRFRACALVLGAVVLGAACSSSGGKHAQGQTATKSSSDFKKQTLKIGTVSVESIGPVVSIPKNTQKAVLASAQTYVGAAMLAPLESGQVGASYAPLFDPGVRTPATTTDQHALTDAGVGKATKYVQTAKPVAISALADGAGTLLYIATNFSVKTVATTDAGPATVSRDVELTFAPAGSSWVVTAYRVTTVRKLPAAPTNTTVASAGSKP